MSGVSRINQMDAVKAHWHLAPDIAINDVTLREGDQTLAVPFTVEDKLLIARALDALGIQQIQAGWPARKVEDQEVIRRLRNTGMRAKIEAIVAVYGPKWQEDIDTTIACGPDVIDLMHPVSDIRLEIQKISRGDVIRRVKDVVGHASGHNILVRFAAIDATRSDPGFLKDVASQAVEAGAQRIGLADTVGASLPGGMAHLVREVAKTVSVPIQVHTHNDCGLAMANCLAALEAGASILDASVHGMGERAGNVALEELVVALQVLYGLGLGIRSDGLFELSRLVSKITGVAVPPNKPLVGQDVFEHKLDSHAQAGRIHPKSFEAIGPDVVGRRRPPAS